MKKIVPTAFIVINLARDPSRWQYVANQCRFYNITCVRYEAIDASAWYGAPVKWEPRIERALLDRGIMLPAAQWSDNPQLSPKPTVIALHMSHLNACRDGFDRFPDAAWLGVVEDDATFLRDPSVLWTERDDAQLVHLHERARYGYGREGYVLTARACRKMSRTLPLRRPGDLTLFALGAAIPQATSTLWYVREARDRFGSSKFFIHLSCRDHGTAVPELGLPVLTAAQARAAPPPAFLMRKFDQDSVALVGRSHCVQWYNASHSAWRRRRTTRPNE